jgi:hypothetical protein
VNAIALVVDRFSDKIVENPKLNVNPQLSLRFNPRLQTARLRGGWLVT